MLYVAGFPMFILFFFGIFAYFLWKTFTQPSSTRIREVFEFYLAANEILTDNGRRWFGFEVHEVIARGEKVLHTMNGAPPLVYFTLGALYHKIGNHKSAVNHLSYVVESEFSGEEHYAFATPELKNYVKVLRKIEREPAEAPQTSAAIRALERSRRNRAKSMLEESRHAIEAEEIKNVKAIESETHERAFSSVVSDDDPQIHSDNGKSESQYTDKQNRKWQHEAGQPDQKASDEKQSPNPELFANRKPISEVLHDIYDDA